MAAVALLALAPAGASVESTHPYTCDDRTPAKHIKEARATLKAGWAKKKWRDGSPVKPAQRRQITEHLECLDRGKDRKAIKRYAKQRKEAFFLYREYRRVAPYPGPGGTWWAIPYYIIACESGGNWSAYNPSGARGAYQFLGWPVPWPVRNFRDKLAHHKMAAQLSLSNWVCA